MSVSRSNTNCVHYKVDLKFLSMQATFFETFPVSLYEEYIYLPREGIYFVKAKAQLKNHFFHFGVTLLVGSTRTGPLIAINLPVMFKTIPDNYWS